MLDGRWDVNLQKTNVTDIKNLELGQEYVFIPITRYTSIITQGRTIVVKPGGIQILTGSEHITKIENGRTYNVLEITGHVVDENSCRLIPTLSCCNHVKGILVHGRPQSNDFLTLRLPADNLHLIRKKGEIPDVVTIYIPYSTPDANNSIKTRLVHINDDSIIDRLVNEVFEKIYTITHKEKFKEDIKELFEYYHALQQ